MMNFRLELLSGIVVDVVFSDFVNLQSRFCYFAHVYFKNITDPFQK